jgi:predicted dinucleotide-binding enzyme
MMPSFDFIEVRLSEYEFYALNPDHSLVGTCIFLAASDEEAREIAINLVQHHGFEAIEVRRGHQLISCAGK